MFSVGNELFAFNGVNVQVAVDFNPGTSGSFPRKLVGNADRLAVWNDLRNRMDEHTSQYLAAHAGEQTSGTGVWFCR